MPRKNLEVEDLERQVRMLQNDIARIRRPPEDIPADGCGSQNCDIKRPLGMMVGGECKCLPREVRATLRYWRNVAEHRAEIIREQAHEVFRAGSIIRRASIAIGEANLGKPDVVDGAAEAYEILREFSNPEPERIRVIAPRSVHTTESKP